MTAPHVAGLTRTFHSFTSPYDYCGVRRTRSNQCIWSVCCHSDIGRAKTGHWGIMFAKLLGQAKRSRGPNLFKELRLSTHERATYLHTPYRTSGVRCHSITDLSTEPDKSSNVGGEAASVLRAVIHLTQFARSLCPCSAVNTVSRCSFCTAKRGLSIYHVTRSTKVYPSYLLP